jgi:hypothetical protein
MKTRIISALVVIAALAGFSLPATADDSASVGRVPTVTRLVKIFSTLENDLNGAVLQRNAAVVEKLLASDFEMRTAAMPGMPIPRVDWIRQSMSDPAFASHTEQMAAHDYGNVVVVSFLWNVDATAGTDAAASIATRFFVVDTWMQDGGNWRLGARYVAPATSDAHVPGLPSATSEIQKKY